MTTDLQVVDIEAHGSGPPRLLIEIPHAADRRSHFDAVREYLKSELPPDLVDFFFVNTDVGATAVAREVAGSLAASGVATRIVRCLVPRTFVDCNRELSVGPDVRTDDGLTPAIPVYVAHPDDREWLASLHRRYHSVVSAGYDEVCGSETGGRAITLHTYAPRTVNLGQIRGDIVSALHAAYEPETYSQWTLRPEIDLISETPEGEALTDASWLRSVREAYESAGCEVEENGAYRLIPGTMGRVYAERHRGRVLCVELRRDLLADPFEPFAEMTISTEKARHLAGPLAASFLATI